MVPMRVLTTPWTLGLLLLLTGALSGISAEQVGAEGLAMGLPPTARETKAAEAEAKLEREGAAEIREVETAAAAKIRAINTYIACQRGEGSKEDCKQVGGGHFKEASEKAIAREKDRQAAKDAMGLEKNAENNARIATAAEKAAKAEERAKVQELNTDLGEEKAKVRGLLEDLKRARERMTADKARIREARTETMVANKARQDALEQASAEVAGVHEQLKLLRDKEAIHTGKIAAGKNENRVLRENAQDLQRKVGILQAKVSSVTSQEHRQEAQLQQDDERLAAEKNKAKGYRQQVVYEEEELHRVENQQSAALRQHRYRLDSALAKCREQGQLVAQERATEASSDAEKKGLGDAVSAQAAKDAYSKAYTAEYQICEGRTRQEMAALEDEESNEAKLRSQEGKICQRADTLEEEAATAEENSVKASANAAKLQAQCADSKGQGVELAVMGQENLKESLPAGQSLTIQSKHLPGGTMGKSVGEGSGGAMYASRVCAEADEAASLAQGAVSAAQSAKSIAHDTRQKCKKLHAKAALAKAQQLLEQAKARAAETARMCKLKRADVAELIKKAKSPVYADQLTDLMSRLAPAKASAEDVCEQAAQAAAAQSLAAAKASAASMTSATSGTSNPEAMNAVAAEKQKQCVAAQEQHTEIKAKYGAAHRATKEAKGKEKKICEEAEMAMSAAAAAQAAVAASQADGIADETQLELEAASAKAQAQAAEAAKEATRLAALCTKSKSKLKALRQERLTAPATDHASLDHNIQGAEASSKDICAKAAAAAALSEKLKMAALASAEAGSNVAALKKMCRESQSKLSLLELQAKSNAAVNSTLPQMREQSEKLCFAAERAENAAKAAAMGKACQKMETHLEKLIDGNSELAAEQEMKVKVTCTAAAAAAAHAESFSAQSKCSAGSKHLAILQSILPPPKEIPDAAAKKKQSCANSNAAQLRAACKSGEAQIAELRFKKAPNTTLTAAQHTTDKACSEAAVAALAAQQAGSSLEHERLVAMCQGAKTKVTQLQKDPLTKAYIMRSAMERQKDICASADAAIARGKEQQLAEGDAARRAEADAAHLSEEGALLAQKCKVASKVLGDFELKIGTDGLNNPLLNAEFKQKQKAKSSVCKAAAEMAAQSAAAKLLAEAAIVSPAAALASLKAQVTFFTEACKNAKKKASDAKQLRQSFSANPKSSEDKKQVVDIQLSVVNTKKAESEMCTNLLEAETRHSAFKEVIKTGLSLADGHAAADAAWAAKLAELCTQHKNQVKEARQKLLAAPSNQKWAFQQDLEDSKSRANATCAKAARQTKLAAASKVKAESNEIKASTASIVPASLSGAVPTKPPRASLHEMEKAKMVGMCTQAKSSAESLRSDFMSAKDSQKATLESSLQKAQAEAKRLCAMAEAAPHGQALQAQHSLKSDTERLQQECQKARLVYGSLKQRLDISPENTTLAGEAKFAKQTKEEICDAASAAVETAQAAAATAAAVVHTKAQEVGGLNRTMGKNVKRIIPGCADIPSAVCPSRQALCTHSRMRAEMERNCPFTCGLCVERFTDAPCSDMPKYEAVCPLTPQLCVDQTHVGSMFRRQCPGTCNSCNASAPVLQEKCENLPQYNLTCWLRPDLCNHANHYVKKLYRQQCKETCGMCGNQSPLIPEPVGPRSANCTDHPKYVQSCPLMKHLCFHGDLHVQRVYKKQCPMTCGVCQPLHASPEQVTAMSIRKQKIDIERQRLELLRRSNKDFNSFLKRRQGSPRPGVYPYQKQVSQTAALPANEFQAELHQAITHMRVAKTAADRQNASQMLLIVRGKEDAQAERDLEAGSDALLATVDSKEADAKCADAKGQSRDEVKRANEENTIDMPRVQKSVEEKLAKAEKLCKAAAFAQKTLAGLNYAGDGLATAMSRLALRCDEARQDLDAAKAGGTSNAEAESEVTKALEQRVKATCDKKEALWRKSEEAQIKVTPEMQEMNSTASDTTIQWKIAHKEASDELLQVQGKIKALREKLAFASSSTEEKKLKDEIAVQEEDAKSAEQRMLDAAKKINQFTERNDFERETRARQINNLVSAKLKLNSARQAHSQLFDQAARAREQALAQQKDAVEAKTNVVQALKQAWAESEEAQQAKNRAIKLARAAKQAEADMHVAINQHTAANAPALHEEVSKAQQLLSFRLGTSKEAKRLVAKQRMRVAQDLSSLESLKRSLSDTHFGNVSKAVLKHDMIAMNKTIISDETKLTTLETNAQTVQKQVEKAQARLKAASDKASSIPTLEEKQGQTKASLDHANAELELARDEVTKEEKEKRNIQEDKVQVMELVENALANNQADAENAREKLRKAKEQVKEANRMHEDANAARSIKDEETKSKQLRKAAQEAAMRVVKQGGSVEDITKAAAKSASETTPAPENSVSGAALDMAPVISQDALRLL